MDLIKQHKVFKTEYRSSFYSENQLQWLERAPLNPDGTCPRYTFKVFDDKDECVLPIRTEALRHTINYGGRNGLHETEY